ncbi:substrate-binding domain-containing protein [Burkholderia sp. Bp9012]|uniref:molybdate ABC transporter substrate-binding protein n=1 Tax=Burkholderia sp. Bp9012 TaxID=2184562 RepID=UPI00162AA887|nr:substrate-binding domain-containing protein [Burkholderia sp. Bp9012]
MKITSLLIGVTCFAINLLVGSTMAQAAELKVLSAQAMRSVLAELAPPFERSSGHKLKFEFDSLGVTRRRIDLGESFDVAILTPSHIDELMQQGKVAAGTRCDLARSFIGVVVRAGGPRPDIATVEAFRQTMLDAKSISYSDEGATALYLSGMFERLGIAEAMKGKTKLARGGTAVQLVAAGTSELGITVINAIPLSPGVDLLGSLPPGLEHHVDYAAGMAAASTQQEAARAWLDFLKTPAAVAVIKAKGLQAVAP